MTSKNSLVAITIIALGILLTLVGYFSGGRWFIIKDGDGLHVPGSHKLIHESYNLDKFTSINIVNDYGDITIVSTEDNYKLMYSNNKTSRIMLKMELYRLKQRQRKKMGLHLASLAFLLPLSKSMFQQILA